ncbi:hypothetical protein A6456_33825 [Paraburkholderia tropica]|nr:hypothetical protein [Paraburkholderia tropica]OBR50051.1 hypothetical protein A6456_33825 [Paraburkholderia tropica]
MSSPAQRRELVQQVIEQHDYSERRACALVGLNRRTFRRPVSPDADHEVRQRMRELAQERPRFGSPRLHVLLRREGPEIFKLVVASTNKYQAAFFSW